MTQLKFNAFGVPALPFGVPALPNHSTSLDSGNADSSISKHESMNGLTRALSYAADHQGCGFWRMHWPESVINGQQLGVISNNNFMIMQENFYRDINCVRVQRQVTPTQLEFVKYLRHLSDKTNKFKIYYEIDDVIFPEDIPLYNSARNAFVDPLIATTAVEIMKHCDAITTPTEYMSKYYTEKTGMPSITLPNYLPKFWIDRFYNKSKVIENFDLNKRRPRIGYVGSPTHFNVSRVAGAKDDIGDILELINKTKKDYKWVFMGGVPPELAPLVRTGDIEYVPWMKIYDYPYVYNNLKLNLVVAPLQDNKFNLAKAPIKYLEAGALGIPCICQDLVPYKMAPLRFNNTDELAVLIKKIVFDRRNYLNESDNARKVATQWWLEDHINEYVKLYFS